MQALIPLKYRIGHTYDYEALRQGSLTPERKKRDYQKFYKYLKRQQRRFEKSEFSELEFQRAMAGELTPYSQTSEEDIDAKLATMAQMIMNETLNVSELKKARLEFYEDYSDVLSDRFYSDVGKKTINPDVYTKFVNFVQVAHHTHMGELLADSDRITHFKNIIGKERWEAMDSDELYTEFFDYLEQEEIIAREEASW